MGRPRKVSIPTSTINPFKNAPPKSSKKKARQKKLHVSTLRTTLEHAGRIQKNQNPRIETVITDLKDKINSRLERNRNLNGNRKTQHYIQLLSILKQYDDTSIQELLELPTKIITKLNKILDKQALKRITSVKDVYEFINNIYYYYDASLELEQNPEGKMIDNSKDPLKNETFKPVKEKLKDAAKAIMGIIEIASEVNYMKPHRHSQLFNPNQMKDETITLNETIIQKLLIKENQESTNDVSYLLTIKGKDDVRDIIEEFEGTIEIHKRSEDMYELTVKALQVIRDQLIDKICSFITIIITLFH